MVTKVSTMTTALESNNINSTYAEKFDTCYFRITPDLERYADLVSESPEISQRTICFQRHIHGISECLRSQTKDLTPVVRNLRNPTKLIDTVYEATSPTPDISMVEKSVTLCALLTDRVPSAQLDRAVVPATLLNNLNEFLPKSDGAHARVESTKNLVSSLRAELRRMEETGSGTQLTQSNLMRYLLMFHQRISRMLRYCITNMMDMIPPSNHSINVENSLREGALHFSTLVHSTVSLMTGERPYTAISISNGLPKREWSDPLMIESRGRELAVLSSYLNGSSKLPGLLYGAPGAGKSSLLRWAVKKFQGLYHGKISEDVQEHAQEKDTPNPVVSVCCAGRTCLSTSLQSILVRLTEEISVKFNCPDAQFVSGTLCEYAEAVCTLHRVFALASAATPLLVVLDDIENIYPQDHLGLFRWLPPQLPSKYVRILLTTSSESVMAGFSKRFGEECCLILSPCFNPGRYLSNILPLVVFNRMHENGNAEIASKTLRQESKDLANEVLQNNTAPAYVDLLADILATYQTQINSSYPTNLPESLSELFAVRLKQMWDQLSELQHLYRALLRLTAYLGFVRLGLTLNEMIDLIQVDTEFQKQWNHQNSDEFLQKFPLGCLLNFLYSPTIGLHKYLLLLNSDSRCLISFKSEAFKQGAAIFWGSDQKFTPERPVTEQAKDETSVPAIDIRSEKNAGQITPLAKTFHNALIDYWLGMTIYSKADDETASYRTSYYWQRGVSTAAPQPATSNAPVLSASYRLWICNSRKLTELPFQFVRVGSERIQELLRRVVFSYDYLVAKILQAGRTNDLISELYYLRQVNEIRGCDEVNHMLGLLRKLTPTLATYPLVLSVELAGRTGHLVGTEHYLIGRSLLTSIDKNAHKVNCLLPLLINSYSPILQPELLSVRFARAEDSNLLCLTPDQRFLVIISPMFTDQKNEELRVVMWEVNTLTKASVSNLGVWPGYQFHAAQFPPQQNQLLYLQYSMKTNGMTTERGYLQINLDFGCVDVKVALPVGSPVMWISLTRTMVLIAPYEQKAEEEEKPKDKTQVPREKVAMATVYSLSNGKALSKFLTNIPTPCLALSGERYCVGPAHWSIPGPVESEIKTRRKTARETAKNDVQKHKNMLQIRQVHTPTKISAWLNCPFAPAVIKSSFRGEYLYVGCSNFGYICRYELNQVVAKEVRKIAPSLELDIGLGVRGISSWDAQSGQLNWDRETFNILTHARKRVSVEGLWVSQDDRYLAASYRLSETICIIGIWHISSKQLLAGTVAWADSQIRFGADANGTSLIHFVRSSQAQAWIEIVDLNLKTSAGTGQKFASKSAVPSSPKVCRLPGLGTPIDDCHFVRGGNLLIVTRGELFLTSTSALSSFSGERNRGATGLVGNQLSNGIYHEELDIIYTTDSAMRNLMAYYNLITQKIVRIGCKRSEDSKDEPIFFPVQPLFEEYPTECYISDDGGYLALVYRVLRTSTQGDKSKPGHERENRGYVKPQLPRINYYTSQFEPDNTNEAGGQSSTGLDSAHEQKIIRLYELNHQGGGSGLRSQISLMGENIFSLTGKHGLYTIRPDHASTTRLKPLQGNGLMQDDSKTASDQKKSPNENEAKPKAMLSRYSATTGEFLGNTFLDHPVIAGSQFVSENDYLLLCSGSTERWLRLLSAPTFENTVYEINVTKILKQQDDYARTPDIHRVFACVEKPTIAIIQFTWPEQPQPILMATFNLSNSTSSVLIAQFSSTDPLVDVTSDGILGIDAGLRLYNLQKGNLLATLNTPTLVPGQTEEPQLLCTRVTPDRAYILTVACSRTTAESWLVVIKNNSLLKYPVTGLALLSPLVARTEAGQKVAELPRVRLEIGHSGRMIVVALDDYHEFKAFVLRDNATQFSTQVCSTPAERIRNLLPIGRQGGESRGGAEYQRSAKRLDEVFERFDRVLRSSDGDSEGDLDDLSRDDGFDYQSFMGQSLTV
ncbi:unnamed protein product [Calicophoron daubneyi]|uniref:Uncharacterized protein n=1 Tax=Calicophoron daubneyi TaxID=300641 RepID=A0AAV2TIF3_CALDB